MAAAASGHVTATHAQSDASVTAVQFICCGEASDLGLDICETETVVLWCSGTMCDSDSDSDYEDVHHTRGAYETIFPSISSIKSIDLISERWRQIHPSLKKETCHVMHIYVFWWHILLRQQETSRTTKWAVQVGFLDANIRNDLSLKRLYKIEILESILRALAKGTLSDDLAKHLIIISERFSRSYNCVDEAVHWLERTGEPEIASMILKLGTKRLRWLILSFVFTEYAQYMEAMAIKKMDVIAECKNSSCDCCVKKSEEMRKKGNDQFQKRKFDAAVKWYTKAIKYHPENHYLYGNRALCFIRSDKYQKAIGDGKRATILQPSWAKGHYRFCDALFSLGEHVQALEANEKAQALCRHDPDGTRDLLQQNARFRTDMESSRGGGKRKKNGMKKDTSRKLEADGKTEAENHQCSDEPGSKIDQSTIKEPETRGSQGEFTGTGKEEGHSEDHAKLSAETIREMPRIKSHKIDPVTPEKQKMKGRNQQPQEKTLSNLAYRDIRETLRSLVHDAHTALADQRWRNAEQAFSQALGLLDSTWMKELNLSPLDHVILIYGHATALQEIGQPEELAEAEAHFHRIETEFNKVRHFQCLVYYGIGKVYLKQNRFSEALDHFNKSLIMVNRQIIPGKQTWPTTMVVVEETQTEYLKDVLETSIAKCKFPPKPDAICHYPQCLGHSKFQIYFTDPDFKGFIRMICCHMCRVEYHISCWKKMKSAFFSDKNDKDFLQSACFTPDCGGKISKIVIYGSTGLIKCEFESPIKKSNDSRKSAAKQKCTSLKKLKSKEDRKLRRKQFRKVIKREAEYVPSKREETELESQDKAPSQTWLIYGDHILQQISENQELLKEMDQNISDFVKFLRPWTEMHREKDQMGSADSLEVIETVGDVLDMLLEKKNRVWARVFLHTLSNSVASNPKVHHWAQRLNNAGLKAAEAFIHRYCEHLEDLDLNPLLSFPLLQDVLIEKFGIMPEFFGSGGFTITEYLKQAPPNEVRLFIWTLEEHREKFPSFHHALDEYFEIMDGHCIVLKKSDENQSNSGIKGKNRSRKKKQKEPVKPLYVLSGMRSGAHREEEEDDFFIEEDALMLLDYHDPFIVPEYLRDQVAEFEGEYTSNANSSLYRRFFDNNPDPTRESLYDYFAQVLEEHGPMEADNQLLVGEFENFPPEAQQKIEEAGGLKSFLLGSLRFVLTDNLLGLMKHAVSLQDKMVEENGYAVKEHPIDLLSNKDPEDNPQKTAPLNPTAEEFKPGHHSTFDLPFHNSDIMVSPGTPLLSADESLSITTLPLIETNPYTYAGIAPGPIYPVPETPGGFENMAIFTRYIQQPVVGQCGIAHNLSVLIPETRNGIVIDRSDGVYCPESTVSSETLQPNDDYSEHYCFTPKEADLQQYNYSLAIKKGDIDKVRITHPKQMIYDNITHFKKSVAVQVLFKPSDDVSVNTEPYEPFEKNRGDLLQKEKDNLDFEKQLEEMKQKNEEQHQNRKLEYAALEEKLTKVNQEKEVAERELQIFHQRLEDEIKKDQQEKKENQETLKALKNEIKELTESQESYVKKIKEKKKEHDSHLEDFLDLSNMSAAEKMSLEEEMKRNKSQYEDMLRRSQAAEIHFLEYKCRGSLRGLYKCVSHGEIILAKLKEMAALVPSPMFVPVMDAWQACVSDAKEKIQRTESQFKEQMGLVRKGTKLRNLPPVTVPSAPLVPSHSMQCSLLSYFRPEVPATFPPPPELGFVFRPPDQRAGRQAGLEQRAPPPSSMPQCRDHVVSAAV
ncbi:E3 ubiquitin-protein ligase TTC3 isoform X2 [Amia ocellicauda]|uniref:E3 ubiquitin-protein ligase TTC3 isoform X2 n=1 Tax=Amia ocellicauda TaxID=2972642 RepID=UPI003464B72B